MNSVHEMFANSMTACSERQLEYCEWSSERRNDYYEIRTSY